VPGIIGTALAFNGPNDIVTIPHSKSLSPFPQMTLAAWVRGNREQTGEWPRIIDKFTWTEAPVSGRGVVLNTVRGNGSVGICGFWDRQQQNLGNDFSVLDDQWHHLAGSFDGHRLHIYVDGVSRGAKTYTGQFTTSDKDITIGNGFDGVAWYPFKGAIDEVAVFNRALADEEVKRLYELGKRALADKPAAPPAKRFVTKIKADRGWQPAGLLTAGQTVEITAEGKWTWDARNRALAWFDANGAPFTPYLGNQLLRGVNGGSLIGRIGDKVFSVGVATQVVANRTGRLELRINDDDNSLKDNDGELTVAIVTQ
jgi:hypothetical protein